MTVKIRKAGAKREDFWIFLCNYVHDIMEFIHTLPINRSNSKIPTFTLTFTYVRLLYLCGGGHEPLNKMSMCLFAYVFFYFIPLT